jgi:hypothetical protein
MSVGEQKRSGERNFSVPICDPEGMGALMAMDRLNVGPGEPGPGDEWKFPGGPGDDVDGTDDPTREPVGVGPGPGLLHRLTHRG